MQLGKKLATGFVRDDALVTDEEAGPPPARADDAVAAPRAVPLPAPEPEPAAAG